MRQKLSLILTASFLFLNNGAMASSSTNAMAIDDDNDVVQILSHSTSSTQSPSLKTQAERLRGNEGAQDREGAIVTRAPLGVPPMLSGTFSGHSFNFDALILYRELGLLGSDGICFLKARQHLGVQTGNAALFHQDHFSYFRHLSLSELEKLVDQQSLVGALDPKTDAGKAYFTLQALLSYGLTQHMSYACKDLLLCPPLRGATHLKMLDLKHNKLQVMPNLSALTNLEKLYLSKNPLIRTPDFSHNTKLQELYMTETLLTEGPDLSKNSALTLVDLSLSKLRVGPTLPEESNLRVLRLSINQLVRVPSLLNQKNLKHLDVRCNKLKETPDLSKNIALTYLDLSKNQLDQSPNLSNQTMLEDLELSKNNLTEAPVLSHLSKLCSLSLEGNKLTHLPDVSSLSALTSLSLDRGLDDAALIATLTEICKGGKNRFGRIYVSIPHPTEEGFSQGMTIDKTGDCTA